MVDIATDEQMARCQELQEEEIATLEVSDAEHIDELPLISPRDVEARLTNADVAGDLPRSLQRRTA